MFARCANPYHTPRYCRTLSHSSTFRSSTLGRQVPFPARFFDVKWLATESVLLMSSYWLLRRRYTGIVCTRRYSTAPQIR
jgi:hypothetical protein